jgi:predicted acylesterase/phospholipase RssA
MIDTLILSACGLKGIYYVGVFQSLIEHKIIIRTDIKHIVCCSSGSLFGLLFLLGYSLDFIKTIVFSIDFENLFEYDDLLDLFSKNGLFSIDKFVKIFEIALLGKQFKKDITMKELYEQTNINYVLKVYNYTDELDEYISHENYPDIPVLKAISMSCSIPILFKTIEHEDQIETPYTFITNIFKIGKDKYVKKNKQTIFIHCCKGIKLTDFSVKTCDKQDMITHAKLLTDIHVYKYL